MRNADISSIEDEIKKFCSKYELEQEASNFFNLVDVW